MRVYLFILLTLLATQFASAASEKGFDISIESIERNQNQNLGYKVNIELVFKHNDLGSGYISSYLFDGLPSLMLSSIITTHSGAKLQKLGFNTGFSISAKDLEKAKREILLEEQDKSLKLILYRVNVIFVEQKFTHQSGKQIFATLRLDGDLASGQTFSSEKLEGPNDDIFHLKLSLK